MSPSHLWPPPPPMPDYTDLENWFSYHPPTPAQREIYEAIRLAAREYAHLIMDLVPACADRTAAIRKLRETVMAVNLAVACNS